MKQIIGILKFCASLLFLGGCIISFINVLKKYEPIVGILAVIIVATIFGFYIYYLVQTGLRNFKNRNYTINISLVIGLIFHFFLIFLALYYSTIYTRMAVTTVPFALIGLAIGVSDFKQFYQIWKNKKLQIL